MTRRALLLRNRSIAWGAALLRLIVSVCRGAEPDQAAGDEFFESRIRPVLVERCFPCHGGGATEGDLRVDSLEALQRGGARGAALVPGKQEDSLLIQAVRRTHQEVQMPPDEPLPLNIVADFEKWVQDGAPWPASEGQEPGTADPAFAARPHWAFQPLREDVQPPEDPAGWSEHPIDRFISAKHREVGLRPVEEADRRTLGRRMYFDLIGLPPSPAEMSALLADDTPDANERLIDRLLDSPRYGERWGRHWMDVVRYADTAGDNADYPIPEARLYRDYIIDAFNNDKPYDEFVREQLAGDLLARGESGARYAELVTATGFIALSRRYGTAPYELWHLTIEDTIDTVGQAFLGLSLKCARCHDHKFDPVTTEDYYALYGIFDSTQYPWAGAEEFHSKRTHRLHFVPLLPDEEAAPVLARFQEEQAELKLRIGEMERQLAAAAEADQPSLQQELDRLRNEEFNRQRRGLPAELPAAYAVREGAVHDVAVQHSGDPAQPGAVQPRGAIQFLRGDSLPAIPAGQSGRLQLAEWLADPAHPLPARVMVNRIWQQHFGRGLVETPSNFGTRGAAPTHPELLDWLATYFVEHGWSVKQMHRLILTSRTWRLSASDNAANAAIDTGNAYYWRHDRRRLDAEAIRDAMLQVSGLLDLGRPAAHPFPAPQDWHWTQHNPFRDVYATRHRSVYLMTQRIQRHPFLALFDGPDTNASTGRRSVSTVPPQALYLLNSPEMQEIARGLAERAMSAASDSEIRIDTAYQLCFARPGAEAEIRAGQQYLSEYAASASAAGVPADECELLAWTSYARLLMASNEFMHVD
jgi:hypothetical protein